MNKSILSIESYITEKLYCTLSIISIMKQKWLSSCSQVLGRAVATQNFKRFSAFSSTPIRYLGSTMTYWNHFYAMDQVPLLDGRVRQTDLSYEFKSKYNRCSRFEISFVNPTEQLISKGSEKIQNRLDAPAFILHRDSPQASQQRTKTQGVIEAENK